MALSPEQIQQAITEAYNPFYEKIDFWISTLIGTAGLIFSYRAFKEAKRAKAAANLAAYNVRVQSISLELAEIVSGLDKLESDNITYPTVRDTLNHLTRKLTRLMGPFQKTEEFVSTISKIKVVLSETKVDLEQLRPKSGQSPPDSVTLYYAVEGRLSQVSVLVSELIGLMESYSMEHNSYGKQSN